MIIGFDAKRAAQNRTGLGNYSRFVIRLLSQQHPENEYYLYVPKQDKMPYITEIPTLAKLKLHFPLSSLWRRFSSLWRVWGITGDIKNDDVNIFHGLSNELPLNITRAKCKTVVTVHDLIFLHCPQYYHLVDRWIYRYKFRKSCRQADKIIAVSEFTKKEIIRYFDIQESKIEVVYQGCDPVFGEPVSKTKLEEIMVKYNLPSKFLLYVGSIEERKNLMLVAKALKVIRDDDMMEDLPKVVVVGKGTSYLEQVKSYINDNDLSDCFLFFHNVSFHDLPSFYKLATAFVYPSRIEGFGIPLLEALTSGLPAIGCSGSCLEEAGGPGSVYVKPDDAQSMAKAVFSVFNDEKLRDDMIVQGLKYAKDNFSDEKLSDDLMKVYEML